MSVQLRIGERRLEATVGSDGSVTVEGHRFTVERLGDGVYAVTDGAARWRVVVAGPPQDRWVGCDGRIARVEVDTTGRPRARGRTSAHDMSAPMPATVVKVVAPPGMAVRKGDTVLMLEAMKMELPIKASRDGVVAAIRCSPGELVQPGVNLVEIE